MITALCNQYFRQRPIQDICESRIIDGDQHKLADGRAGGLVRNLSRISQQPPLVLIIGVLSIRFGPRKGHLVQTMLLDYFKYLVNPSPLEL